ncbi:MAG: glycosyltransferase N-terminal domain-containing protein [Candidatus Hatepunaea meridiana]|nr:glycosyltransferase N-terminal domain-containing protein [Candidatus Hatepunaea meridiana]
MDRSTIPRGLWFILYDIIHNLGILLAHIVSPFNGKLRKTLKGRRKGVDGWTIGSADARDCVLLHVASYGEFEGIRPLIDRLNNTGKYRVAISFSSPSAAKTVSAKSELWAYGYLPNDYIYQQLKLFGRLDPRLILISKHDFWPNLLRAAKSLDIPVILINANFHSGSHRTLPVVRSFHRTFMKHLHAVWTVSETDAKRVEPLLSIGTELLSVGDTRYDRVRQRAIKGKERFNNLRKALQPGPVMIAGSTWQQGEKICWAAFLSIVKELPEAKLVVVPHEPTSEALNRNQAIASANQLKVCLFSKWDGKKIGEQVLLVDRMGVLADLYTVGWAAYVGGGFGKGIHSVIEPAAHGLPVMFGPNHHVSHEASLLLEAGGGFVVKTAKDIEKLWHKWLVDSNSYKQASDAAANVVMSREGTAERIIELLEPYLYR